MRIPKGKMNAGYVFAYSGPWNGEKVYLPVNGTMVFRLGKWYGHYDGLGVWHGQP
jgi:hypothetical protein